MQPIGVLCTLVAFHVMVSSTAAQSSPRRYFPADGPIQLNESISSDVINVTNSRSDIECLDMCTARGCAVVTAMLSSRTCQLLVINDASQSPGPVGTHVRRALWSDAADSKVWNAEGVQDLVEKRRLKNFTATFSNISTGSNGSIQQFVVSVPGCYRIEATGAAGGPNTFQVKLAGRGAFMSGSFNLTTGTQLSIVVGQSGGRASRYDYGAGGGGGSFVYGSADSRLYLAAGGGGGASQWASGINALVGANGSDSYGITIANAGIGGTLGQPGFNDPSKGSTESIGGCGAGWLGAPVNPGRVPNDGSRGSSLAGGWFGGQAGDGSIGDGGFGGGGGGGGAAGAAGGGGGFSGGGAGLGSAHAGGGGGSFCSGGGCTGTAGVNAGRDQGLVVIRLLAIATSC